LQAVAEEKKKSDLRDTKMKTNLAYVTIPMQTIGGQFGFKIRATNIT
jgi:hypothetical protein